MAFHKATRLPMRRIRVPWFGVNETVKITRRNATVAVACLQHQHVGENYENLCPATLASAYAMLYFSIFSALIHNLFCHSFQCPLSAYKTQRIRGHEHAKNKLYGAHGTMSTHRKEIIFSAYFSLFNFHGPLKAAPPKKEHHYVLFRSY